MKNVILKFAIFLLGLVAADVIVGFIGNSVIKMASMSSSTSDVATLNYNLNGCAADIIILGSSEAMSAYIPKKIHNRLLSETNYDFSVYNAGGSNQGIAYNYCAFRSIIERKIPKLIILDIVPNYLSHKSDESSTSPLRPYCHYNKYVKELLKYNEDKKSNILEFSNLYCFNSELFKLVMSFRNKQESDGYDPHYGRMPVDSKRETVLDGDNIDPVAEYEFRQILCEAKEKDIPIITVITPKFRNLDFNSASFLRMMELCMENNIPVLNLHEKEIFQNPELFRESAHVNPDGAEICTDLLVDYLLKIYSDEK